MSQASSFEFDELVAQLRAGENDAATEIFNSFSKRLIALARSQLDTQIRQKEDPEDVVQSVFRSFFTRHSGGQFDVTDKDSLWTLLALITVRKCRDRIDYFHAACRNVQRELPPRSGSEPSLSDWQDIAHDPTPSEAAIMAETVGRLMYGLDADDRQIVALHLEGYTVAEISDQVGWAQRTVRRVIDRARTRMRRMQSEAAD